MYFYYKSVYNAGNQKRGAIQYVKAFYLEIEHCLQMLFKEQHLL
jgi:hypothetical protein